MARLQGEGGLSVEVAVSLLVADSRVVRAVLASHEGQEKLVTLVGVEGDTLRHYAKILRTGKTEMRGRDRYPEKVNILTLLDIPYSRKINEESVAKLRRLLKMLGSQVILDYGGINPESGMQEGVNIEENTKKPEDRKSQRSPTGPGTTTSSRKTLNYGPQTINAENEEENRKDVADQTSNR